MAKDLKKRLLSVNERSPLKYLPINEVGNLKLQTLGCHADAILIRKEYNSTVEILKGIRPDRGGAVVTGQSGLGTS